MATTKTSKTTTKERAAVSKERRLALALKAVMDAFAETETATTPDQMDSLESADKLLAELGYDGIEAIPTAIKRLTAELTAATTAGEWSKVSEIGQQLERVKVGLPPTKVKEADAKA